MAVAAGDVHSLALKTNGSVVGWGYMSLDPTGKGFADIAAGLNYGLAVGSFVGLEDLLIEANEWFH